MRCPQPRVAARQSSYASPSNARPAVSGRDTHSLPKANEADRRLSSNPALKECVLDPPRIERSSRADIAHLSESNISEARLSRNSRSSLACAKAVENPFFWWKSKEKSQANKVWCKKIFPSEAGLRKEISYLLGFKGLSSSSAGCARSLNSTSRERLVGSLPVSVMNSVNVPRRT